jgi:hypothetical protein
MAASACHLSYGYCTANHFSSNLCETILIIFLILMTEENLGHEGAN